MAISVNDGINKFDSATTVITTGSTIADGAFSLAGDVTQQTDTNDVGIMVAVFTGSYSVAPNANSSVPIFARLMNIDGTNDQQTPDANFQNIYCGGFPLNDVTGSQTSRPIEFAIPSVYTSQVVEYFIQNEAGQPLSAGATVKVTPKTRGPKAA